MKTFYITIILFLFFPFLKIHGTVDLKGKKQQGKNHNPIMEEVIVTNVQVPVRVTKKGKPVINLTKDDFILFENEKKQNINGFFLEKKKLLLSDNSKLLREGDSSSTPRTFVLVFSITDFNERIIQAVNHLFENTFSESDRLLIFAHDKRLEYQIFKDNKEEIKKILLSEIKEESKNARNRLSQYINKIETYLNIYDFVRELEIIRKNPTNLAPQKIISFLNKFLHTWMDYKLKYLTPKLDRFYYFSRYLQEIDGEKWVLNFYQFDLFPNIRMCSRTMQTIQMVCNQLLNSNETSSHALGRLINSTLNKIQLEFNVSKNFPIDTISKLFYKANATFHSFFIKSTKKACFGDLQSQEVTSDIEKLLKKITEVTGGRSITSNNLVKSLNSISEVEDVYYMLTYTPQNPLKAGKIKIKIKNKKYNVMYDDNFREEYISDYFEKLENKIHIPEIKIENLSFKEKILAFTIKDYLMKKIDPETQTIGKMKVRVRLNNDHNFPLFDQAKILMAQKDQLKISLKGFKKIKRGDYQLIIDATDLLTGRETNSHHFVSL